MRFVIALILSLVALPALAAQECTRMDIVIHEMGEKFPDARFHKYEGQEAAAIQAGMASMGAKLEGERVFLVFSNGSGVDLLIGFFQGCYEGAAQVPHELIDGWLAGTES